MPKGYNSHKFLPIKDGLGICRQCAYFDPSEFPLTIHVGDKKYFDAICLQSKLPCYLTRSSLLSCFKFEKLKQPRKEFIVIRLIKSFINNDWSHLK
jgi:hypothetical protein